MNRKTKFLLVYGITNVFTLVMLLFLQISEIPIFFLWLVLMHLGIIGLALTKKKFKDLAVKPYFKRVYISFALFIPILIYKLIIVILSKEENDELVKTVVISVMIICVVVLIYNIISFIFKNRKQTSQS